MIDPIHSTASSLREQYLEYGFLDGLCKVMWKRGVPMDVLRSHTDQSGYDLLLEAQGIGRHVQLKSTYNGGRTSKQSINSRLADRPSGCVVWIWFDKDTLEQTSFRWFGAEPGKPLPSLPDRIGKHSKGNAHGFKADRPTMRIVNKGEFESIAGFEELAGRLFGNG
jgi:hypothetical protein